MARIILALPLLGALDAFPADMTAKALSVISNCTVAASDASPIHGMRVPFIAPGGHYGSDWWQLDFSEAMLGYRHHRHAFCETGILGLAAVMKENGRIPLYGHDQLPEAKGWFPEQREGVASLPAHLRVAYLLAMEKRDNAFSRQVLDLMLRNLAWWRQARLDAETGLVTSLFEETFPPYLGHAGEYAAPDTCAEVAEGAALAAKLATALGDAKAATEMADFSKALYAACRRHLWDEANAMFRPLNLRDRTFGPKVASGYVLLRDPGLPANIREKAIATLKGPLFGWHEIGLTTLAKDDPLFQYTPGPEYQGNRSWSGMVWSLVNIRVAEALSACGHEADARHLRQRTIELLEGSDDFYEFYDPRNAAGCGVKGYAWTAGHYLELKHIRDGR